MTAALASDPFDSALTLLADQLGAHAITTATGPSPRSYALPETASSTATAIPGHAETDAATSAARRARRPGYTRWLNHVSAAGGCQQPIRLTGHLHTINPITGEVLTSTPTATMPDGVLYVPCGDRRATVCPACAETYRADTYHLVRAGLVGGKGVPESVAAHPCVFVTLTAPSFGPVHTRVIDRRTGKIKPCRVRRRLELCRHGRPKFCSQRHGDDARCVSRPLCPDCYDYPAHVIWNAWAGELWRRTTITANRLLRPLAQQHGVQLRLSFAKVAEYQARGLVHFHALIRLDAIDPTNPDALIAPPAALNAAHLDQAITRAVASVRVQTPPHPERPDGWTLTWGRELDIRPVQFGGELTDIAVASYLAKYATKSTENTGHISRRITTDTIDIFADTATHVGRIIRTCWKLGRRPDHEHPADWKQTYGRLRRWAHMLGFGGHFATKSRRYSTTRAALKQTRRAWRQRRAHIRPAGHDTADHTDDETTLIIGVLTFAGIGYRTIGDHWLALTAAAKAREQRQTAKEERMTRLAS